MDYNNYPNKKTTYYIRRIKRSPKTGEIPYYTIQTISNTMPRYEHLSAAETETLARKIFKNTQDKCIDPTFYRLDHEEP